MHTVVTVQQMEAEILCSIKITEIQQSLVVNGPDTTHYNLSLIQFQSKLHPLHCQHIS
jgi:hypothetical protein